MKINSNIPIFAILTIFVASNAILYRYLNDGYFIDKKPDTKSVVVENVIFSLIGAHELVLAERNAAILAEAQRLREMRATITDSDELQKIEDQLRALEEESKAVLERVKNSENERAIAVKQSQNDKVQLSDLLESNSRMGADLDNINKRFDNYVTTIEETLISNSYSEVDISRIKVAFNNNKGLEYVTDLVGNIQDNKSQITKNFTKQLKDRSDSYLNGLKLIAREINDDNFIGNLDDKELLNTEESINNLKASIDRYKLSRDREVTEKEQELLKDLNNKLSNLSSKQNAKRQDALDALNLKYEEILEQFKADALVDKELSLQNLENRLREELVEKESVVKVDLPSPDQPIYTSWVHIPGLWTSTPTEISYGGKRVDSIAWSRNSIEDNQSISFDGKFDSNGECLLILYGNGRFKSWTNGLIISISNLAPGRAIISLSRNGIDENSDLLYSNSLPIDGSISGTYYIQMNEGKLSIDLNGAKLLNNFPVDIDLNGRIGFGNREMNSHDFAISNIKLFKIR